MHNVIKKLCCRSKSICALGLYERNHLGYEVYKSMFSIIFGSTYNIDYFYIYDIKYLPKTYDAVVCCGGNIISYTFINKIKDIIDLSGIPVYALCVGLDTGSLTDIESYDILSFFDHVFTRTKVDYQKVMSLLGSKNVSYLPELLVYKCMTGISGGGSGMGQKQYKTNRVNIGLCLSQTVFSNSKYTYILDNVVILLTRLYEEYKMSGDKQIAIHFISFNNQSTRIEDCDLFLYQRIISRLPCEMLPMINMHVNVYNSHKMIEIMNNMHINICMRYFSVMFSILANTRFIALSYNGCIANLVKELQSYGVIDQDFYIDCCKEQIDMDNLINYKCSSSGNVYADASNNLAEKLYDILTFYIDNHKFTCYDIISDGLTLDNGLEEIQNVFGTHKLRYMLFHQRTPSLTEAKTNIIRYLSRHDPMIDYNTLSDVGPLRVKGLDCLSTARIISYAITDTLDHPCLWGLAEHITLDDFQLSEAVDMIFMYHNKIQRSSSISPRSKKTREEYYDRPHKMIRRRFVHVDPFINYGSTTLHRKYNDYFITLLLNYNSNWFGGRKSGIIVDTYVERTFNWEQNTLAVTGYIPYSTPWIGFVHHIYDSCGNEYSCKQLIRNGYFLSSLNTCKALIVPTHLLASQLCIKLQSMGFDIPVHVLYHPTRFDVKTKSIKDKFTWKAFLQNKERKVVQIGSWLHRTCSICDVPISPQTTNIKKAILKEESLDKVHSLPNEFLKHLGSQISSSYNLNFVDVGQLTKRVFASPFKCTRISRCTSDMLRKNDSSIEFIKLVDETTYNNVLANNIVFLEYMDNSDLCIVIDCIVRNTILIVNKTGVIEEFLGCKYPGYYTSLKHAGQILSNFDKLKEIHDYMNDLDKKRFDARTFLDEFNKILDSDV